jgi:hypothetical protein
MGFGGILVGLFAAWICPAQEPDLAANLLRNPSFEEHRGAQRAPRAWQSVSGSWQAVATEDAPHGEAILLQTDEQRSLLRQFVRWSPGSPAVLQLTASFRATDALELRVRAESVDGRALRQACLIARVHESWQRESLWLRVPAGTDRVRIELRAEGPVELDQLELGAAKATPPSFDALLAQLNSGSTAQLSRGEVLRSLGLADPARALSSLVEIAMNSPEPAERAQAWACLAELGEPGLERIWARLDQGLQAEGVLALARERNPELLARLPQLLPAPLDVHAAELLEQVAAEYPLDQVFPSLLAPQLDPTASPVAQDAALHVLADSMDERFFAGLDAVYPQASADRRARWLAASARFDNPTALEELAKYVRSARGVDLDPAERAFLSAARSMRSLEARAWLLEHGLSHRVAFVRRASLIALGPEFEPIEIAAALSLTRDADPRVLRTLIPILAAHPSDAAGKALQDLVSHRVPEVAADALRGYWQLRGGDSVARTLSEGMAINEGHWAVQSAAILLLADEPRALPKSRLDDLAVEARDWRVRRAAAQVLRARGQGLPAQARPTPEQPSTVYVLALPIERIQLGAEQTVGPWLQLRDRIGLAQDGEDQIWFAALKPKKLTVPLALAPADRVLAFDRWFLQQSSLPGAASLGGLRAALDQACRISNAVELVLVIDTDLREGELADWFDLMAELRVTNAHQSMQIQLMSVDAVGRLDPVLGAYRRPDNPSPIGK